MLATGGGIATTTAGGALAQAKDALTPLADSSDWIARVVAVLVIAGVVADDRRPGMALLSVA